MCQFRKLQGAGRGGRREAQRQREGSQGPLTPAVSFQNRGTYSVWGRAQDMGMFRESPLAGLRKATPQLWPQERGGVSKGTFKTPPAPLLQPRFCRAQRRFLPTRGPAWPGPAPRSGGSLCSHGPCGRLSTNTPASAENCYTAAPSDFWGQGCKIQSQ